jgi:hypothetical protein
MLVLHREAPAAARATVTLTPIGGAAMPVHVLWLMAMGANNRFVDHDSTYSFLLN